MSIEIILRFLFDGERSFDLSQLKELLPSCEIKLHRKGKEDIYSVMRSNLVIDIIRRNEFYNEQKIKDTIKTVFKYINKDDSTLEKEFYVSFVSDENRSGFEYSEELIQLLYEYNLKIIFSGIFI